MKQFQKILSVLVLLSLFPNGCENGRPGYATAAVDVDHSQMIEVDGVLDAVPMHALREERDELS